MHQGNAANSNRTDLLVLLAIETEEFRDKIVWRRDDRNKVFNWSNDAPGHFCRSVVLLGLPDGAFETPRTLSTS